VENGPYKWVSLYVYNLVAGLFILYKIKLLSFSVCCNTGMYSALKVIYCLLLLKSLLWENIVYTMGLIVEVVIWDKLILYPRQTKISTNQMIVEFMGAGLKLHIPQNTPLLNQVHFLVWSRYSIHFPSITHWFYFPPFTLFILCHFRIWNGQFLHSYFIKILNRLEV
jgi:hypothetical protein